MRSPRTDQSRFDRLLPWAPPLIALLVAAPNILWPFLWDDFEFLNRTALLQARDFLPQSGAALYRPISQVAYFALLGRLGPASAFVAHLVNAAAVVGSVYLLSAFLRRRVGIRAAVVGGFMFAAVAWFPTLVGWASGCQDLLCLLFLLAAFNLADVGRPWAALVAFAVALLAKETAIVVAPALLLLHSRRASKPGGHPHLAAIATILAVLLWVLIHPWTRRVLHLGSPAPLTGYVPFQGADLFRYGSRGLLSLLNLTWSLDVAWRTEVIVLAGVASAVTLLSLDRAWRPPIRGPAQGPGRAYWLAASLIVLGPFLLTTAFIGYWAPYYACIPAAGLAMLAAPGLARRGPRLATTAILAFLWLGVFSRMSLVNPEINTESNLRETVPALNRVERGFKALRPTLPQAARVYVCVMVSGRHGIFASLYKDPPLRVWYGDPHIELLDPLRMTHGSLSDLLFWVSPNLDVFEVDVQTLRPRSSGPEVSFYEYQKTLRAYATGLAGAGQVDRAVTIFTTMPQYSEVLRAMDWRTAAMFLYAAGRTEEARRLRDSTTRFQRVDALSIVASLAAKPVGSLDLSSAALWALDFSPNDTAAVREVMRFLAAQHYEESARAFARRLATLVPGDPEAERILKDRG